MVTASVFTGNVAMVAPPARLTLPGTIAAQVVSLARETDTPPVGAGAFRVSIPVDGTPPVTADGFKLTEVIVSAHRGMTVNIAACVVL